MQMIIILRTSLRAVLFEGQHIDELCVYFHTVRDEDCEIHVRIVNHSCQDRTRKIITLI
jgi:hypothetical protein